MDPFSQAGLLVIQTLFHLYLLAVLLRFLLQLARADFYNPITQFCVKITAPVLTPLRKIIPGFGGVDIASLILALIIHFIGLYLALIVTGYAGSTTPLLILFAAVLGNVGFILNIYFWGMIIAIIASFVAPASHHPALVLVNQLVEPVMAPLQRIIPPMGGLDFSPILLFLIINVLKIFLSGLLAPLGVAGQLVFGF